MQAKHLCMAIALIMLGGTFHTAAQGAFIHRLGKSAQRAAENAVERQVEKKVEKEVEKAFDKKAKETADDINEGRKALEEAVGWACASCGHAGNTGNFCSKCGKPFEAEGNVGVKQTSAENAPKPSTPEAPPAEPPAPRARKTFDTEQSRLNASNPFFAFKEDLVLTYADKDAKGKPTAHSRQRIVKLEREDDYNFTVSYAMELLDKKMNPLTDTPLDVTIRVVDGDVAFDPSSTLGQMANGMEIEGRGMTVPSDLHVGQTLEGYTVSIPAMAVTSTASDIRVSAREELTTPAGTFDCYKVEMKISGKAAFIKTNGSTITWYARGVGAVRTENYDAKGRLQTSTELVELITP